MDAVALPILPGENKMSHRFHAMVAVMRCLIVCALLLPCLPARAASSAWGAYGGGMLNQTRVEGQTATLLNSGKVLVVGGIIVNSTTPWIDTSSAEIGDPVTHKWIATGSLTNARDGQTATLLPSGKVLVVGGENGEGIPLASAELYDPTTGTWTTAGNMTAARDGHTATLLLSGKVLVAGGHDSSYQALASAEIYDPATNTWSPASSMAYPRDAFAATLLLSGKVLVEGSANSSYSSSAELYDPTANTWNSAGTMSYPRDNQTATLLGSGKVLVAGSGFQGATAHAELYDPGTNSWSSAGTMLAERLNFTATLVPSGQVLVSEGASPTSNPPPPYIQLYDPATNSWSASINAGWSNQTATLLPSGEVMLVGGDAQTILLGPPPTSQWIAAAPPVVARSGQTATLLSSGKVLVAGGSTSGGSCNQYPGDGIPPILASTETYDPSTNTWAASAPMTTARYDHLATLLLSGKVLIVGGTNFWFGGGACQTGGSIAGAELYDPATNIWSSATPGNGLGFGQARYNTITLLYSGKVLVDGSGGAELYDPTTNTWSMTGPHTAPSRVFSTATLLPSGQVLVAGGAAYDATTSKYDVMLSSAELYDPATNTWSATGSMALARENHSAILLPSGLVLVAGGDLGPSENNVMTTEAELYDPTSSTWREAAGFMGYAYAGSEMVMPIDALSVRVMSTTLLPSGHILGLFNDELYDPASELWQPASPNAILGTTTLLRSGLVFVEGLDYGVPGPSAALYAFDGVFDRIFTDGFDGK